MIPLFSSDTFEIRPLDKNEIDSTLEVYRQCEDFLTLGPAHVASMNMVRNDIDHSIEANGIYCGIWNEQNEQIGVLDFIPMADQIADLSLLMISKKHRQKGIGTRIMKDFETYLKINYKTRTIHSGVQVNNELGIIFWKKCGYIIGTIARDMHDGTIAFEMYKEI
jgi:ribosomal protein S18 acetylase RimI-like enzyme